MTIDDHRSIRRKRRTLAARPSFFQATGCILQGLAWDGGAKQGCGREVDTAGARAKLGSNVEYYQIDNLKLTTLGWWSDAR